MTKEESEAVIRGRTDNEIAKIKRPKRMFDKTTTQKKKD